MATVREPTEMRFDPSSKLIGVETHKSKKCTQKGCDCSRFGCSNFDLKTECPPDCHAKCKNQMFAKQHLLPEVEARESDISGTGLYSMVDIKKYALIIFYIGEVISAGLREKRRKKYEKDNRVNYFFEIDGQPTIDPTEYGNRAKYANHSCDPNMVAIPWRYHGAPGNFRAIVFRAEKNIKAGDELTFDYGKAYDDKKCECRSYWCSGRLGKPLSDKERRRKEKEALLEERNQQNASGGHVAAPDGVANDENANPLRRRPRTCRVFDFSDDDEDPDATISDSDEDEDFEVVSLPRQRQWTGSADPGRNKSRSRRAATSGVKYGNQVASKALRGLGTRSTTETGVLQGRGPSRVTIPASEIATNHDQEAQRQMTEREDPLRKNATRGRLVAPAPELASSDDDEVPEVIPETPMGRGQRTKRIPARYRNALEFALTPSANNAPVVAGNGLVVADDVASDALEENEDTDVDDILHGRPDRKKKAPKRYDEEYYLSK